MKFDIIRSGRYYTDSVNAWWGIQREGLYGEFETVASVVGGSSLVDGKNAVPEADSFRFRDTRLYGGDGTIHKTEFLDVELTTDGNVAAVWFRCQPLPFKQTTVRNSRAMEMMSMMSAMRTKLVGVWTYDK